MRLHKSIRKEACSCRHCVLTCIRMDGFKHETTACRTLGGMSDCCKWYW